MASPCFTATIQLHVSGQSSGQAPRTNRMRALPLTLLSLSRFNIAALRKERSSSRVSAPGRYDVHEHVRAQIESLDGQFRNQTVHFIGQRLIRSLIKNGSKA